MSYSKLEVHYTTDGINTTSSVNTRAAGTVKKKTVTLPKKVQDFGDKRGYSSISISYDKDHLILRGGGETLMDLDINGTNNNEYIRSIVKTEWLY